ncbi:hypothetical protein [Parablautia sp. Marseille-Q6255]|uniref:hypothetical protein n=1 Tax=Parablautia sp. Marseille-Q6255 TaxID=3039593 RepID=UPI0024BD1835|nr:hypothetical protein [Parablautia sp. Marseille-Q6255]
MRKIGLSVYGMSVSLGGVEKQNLNNIVAERDIIQIISEYIDTHINEYINDRDKESLFTFCQKDNEEILDDNNRLICKTLCGKIKTGEYGTSSELVNINSGEIYNRSTNQADVMPFGFCIVLPAGEIDTCVIVMQTLGQYGVKVALHKKIQEILRNVNPDLFVSMGPVMPKQYVQKYFNEGVLQKISMIRYEIPEDEAERMGVNYGVAATSEERIIHKPIGFMTRKRIEIDEWMRGQRAATEIIQIDGFDYNNLKLVFKLGKTEKTINLDNLDKIIITEDITEKVQTADGHPIFESLKPVMIETGRGYLVGQGFIAE